MKFNISAQDQQARRGRLELPRGCIETPAFMPVGTCASVKALTPTAVLETGAEIILSNAFHLMLRPGVEIIQSQGGLHKFMGWQKPILIDSGGYQVFSLKQLRKISEDAVRFRSPIDGAHFSLSAERSIEFQMAIGTDIVMIFDECLSYPSDWIQTKQSMERSLNWAKRSRAAHTSENSALFGIIQGGMYADLRTASWEVIRQLDFDGYAIGGLSVGEPAEIRQQVLNDLVPQMTAAQPRYLMGIGMPMDIVQAVVSGVDMFDSVVPTRHARHAQLFTSRGRLRLRNARYRNDPRPPDVACDCTTCQQFSRAYLHHLDRCQEPLAAQLNTVHNLRYYQRLMMDLRAAIEQGTLSSFVRDFSYIQQSNEEVY